MDENRLLMEVTIFADKVCVDEELVRLRSHIETTRDALMTGGSIGRKLDFIAQEMNREANTILSKANDLETSNRAIELKTESVYSCWIWQYCKYYKDHSGGQPG